MMNETCLIVKKNDPSSLLIEGLTVAPMNSSRENLFLSCKTRQHDLFSSLELPKYSIAIECQELL